MPQPVRPFLGESAENRVRARRRLLLDRAFLLMSTDQWRDCSIAQLCRDVELNKRYFYESFQSLAELEDAVVDDLASELLNIGWSSAAQAQQQKLSTEALAHYVLKTCISWLVSDPNRARVLFSKVGDNPRAQAHRDMVVGQLAQALSAFGMEYHHPRQPDIPLTQKHQALARLGSALLIGGSIESILSWVNGAIDLSLDEFTEYVAKFWVALGNSAVAIAVESSENANHDRDKKDDS